MNMIKSRMMFISCRIPDPLLFFAAFIVIASSLALAAYLTYIMIYGKVFLCINFFHFTLHDMLNHMNIAPIVIPTDNTMLYALIPPTTILAVIPEIPHIMDHHNSGIFISAFKLAYICYSF